MRDEKGISVLASAILLILINILAVGVIWYGLMPLINQAVEKGQAEVNNQTANKTIELTPIEKLCKSNCEELKLNFHKVLEIKDIGRGCYCSNKYGYGDILRIW
jgi:hypothetical protein